MAVLADPREARAVQLERAPDLDPAMWQSLEHLLDQMSDGRDESQDEPLYVTAKGSAVVMVAGFVSWILRSGSLLSSLLTTLPLWVRFDPLPILLNARKKQEDEADSESQLGQFLDEGDDSPRAGAPGRDSG